MFELLIGERPTSVTVQPDAKWPGMWRIHKAGRISDMVNLSRAKDAAIAWARPRGLGGNETIHWHHRETTLDAASVRETRSEIPNQASGARP